MRYCFGFNASSRVGLDILVYAGFSFGRSSISICPFLDRKVGQISYDRFSLLAKRQFLGSLGSVASSQAIAIVAIFQTIYFQTALGFTAGQVGQLFLAAGNLWQIFAAQISGRAFNRLGARPLILTGFLLLLCPCTISCNAHH